MNLVEVDGLDSEPRKASFELAPERVASQALQRRPRRPRGLPSLREEVGTLVEPGDRASDDLFGVPEAVLRSRVDPVEAELERMLDRRDRILVLLATPAPVVAASADRPGAEADAGYLEARGSKLG